MSKVFQEPVRSREEFLVFGAPAIGPEEIAEVVKTLESGWIGTGPRVAEFERDFAAYKGVPHAAALHSCTAALHLSLLAAEIGPGDEVITTPLTFCATVNVILHAGATPVLADVDPVTMNIDPVEVERRITPRTRAIIPVHIAGRPCEMDALMALAERHSLVVIEDCAHALETEYRGRPAGTIGDFGCFSFYVNKNLVTGEGGMVIARTAEHHDTIKILGLHGMSRDAWKRFGAEGYKHYQVVAPGYKYNMMDLQAALGVHQLRKVPEHWSRREALWNRYNEAFADLPVTLPPAPDPESRHGYHLYTLLIDEDRVKVSRDGFLDALTRNGIGAGVHYLSIPEHQYYQESLGWRPEEWPHAARVGQQTLSLPFSAKVSDRDASDVIRAVRRIAGAEWAD